MRHNLTETESQLWRKLSGKQLGVAFKRQVPVDRYIADFLAPAVKVVVEVDGAGHSLRRAADARPDRALQRLGYRVLRLDAELVCSNLGEAIAPGKRGAGPFPPVTVSFFGAEQVRPI